MSFGLVIEITEKGRVFCSRMSCDLNGNMLHLLGELAKTKSGMHYPNYFEQFNYQNPTLDECREFLRTLGYTTEHE